MVINMKNNIILLHLYGQFLAENVYPRIAKNQKEKKKKILPLQRTD